MSHEFLDGSNVLPSLKQVSGERVAQAHRLQDQARVEMVPSRFPRAGIAPPLVLWEDPLPTPFDWR